MAESNVLRGTTILVTGGGRGLGRAMTEALAQAGASILIVDIDEEPITETCSSIAGDLHGLRADISVESEVDSVVARAHDLFGHLDVVVNNAGINMHTMGENDTATIRPKVHEIGPYTLRRFFEVHVLAPCLLSRATVGAMLEQGFGRIITITTGLHHMIEGGAAPYGPMKAASEAFTSAMAHELEGTGVTANILHPGASAKTRFVRTPGGGRVEPAVMGPPVVWLSSRASDGVNAKRFTADKWDPLLPPAEAAALSSTPIAWPDEWPIA